MNHVRRSNINVNEACVKKNHMKMNHVRGKSHVKVNESCVKLMTHEREKSTCENKFCDNKSHVKVNHESCQKITLKKHIRYTKYEKCTACETSHL